MSSNYLVDDMYNGKTGRARRLIDEGDVEGLEAWCARNAKRVNESGKWPSWSMSPPDGDIPQNLLSYAAKYGHLEAMAVLLRHGADLDGLERESGPPLLYAAMGGQTEAIEALVRAGASAHVNYASGYLGRTPLCVAAERGKLDTVVCLLRHGASVDHRDENGYDAFGYIMRHLHDDREEWEIDYEKRSMEGWYCAGHDGPPIRVVDLWTTARLVRGVQLVGGWRRFVDEPRRHLALLRELVARGRATPPPLRYNLFDAAALPTDCFFHILRFWRSDAGEQSTREVLAAGAIPEETSDSDDDDWSTRDDKDPGDAADEPTEEELWQQEFEEEWEERWSYY